jgi:hypothetical protein
MAINGIKRTENSWVLLDNQIALVGRTVALPPLIITVRGKNV